MKIDFPLPSQYDQLTALWQEAFHDSEEFIDGFFCTGFSPARCRCVTEEGRIIGALYWFDVQYLQRRYAYVYAVAVSAAHRGRGIGAALMADTHAHLKLRGYEGVLLMPQEENLRKFYAKLGYTDCTRISHLSCEAAQTPVALRRIDRDEYARLRRTYLPEGGAIQEEENIAYLEMMAFFYAGPDFLLAARKDGAHLEGLELLGNTTAAAGILAALSCAEGHFRIPGSDCPQVMCLPLVTNAVPPSYLGLVFD